jgi:hypothetical protein
VEIYRSLDWKRRYIWSSGRPFLTETRLHSRKHTHILLAHVRNVFPVWNYKALQVFISNSNTDSFGLDKRAFSTSSVPYRTETYQKKILIYWLVDTSVVRQKVDSRRTFHFEYTQKYANTPRSTRIYHGPQYVSVRYGTVRYGTVRYGTVRYGRSEKWP